MGRTWAVFPLHSIHNPGADTPTRANSEDGGSDGDEDGGCGEGRGGGDGDGGSNGVEDDSGGEAAEHGED